MRPHERTPPQYSVTTAWFFGSVPRRRTGSVIAQLFSTMTSRTLLIVASLLAVAPVSTTYAQDEGDKPQPTLRMPDGSRQRVGEATGRAVERTAAPAPVPAAPRGEAAPAPAAPAAAPAAPDQRARERQGSRDRGDNPPVGRAVPRDEGRAAPAPPPSNGGRNDGRAVPRYRGGTNVYVTPPAYNYYYYPRRYYPYGYGAFGLGYFYYDPYTWYPGSSSGYYGGSYPGPLYDSFDVGQLRIDVSPRSADVYVDGYFAGRVDDYDGVFQALKLEAGPHHIQIVAQGFVPLDFDVRIEPDRKITYRGALVPYRP
jgi:hypothetical protein